MWGMGRFGGRLRISLGEEGWRDFREGAVSLALCNFGDYVSGFFLQMFTPVIRSAPFLMALLPAASDARGDVYSSYGSRLGTILHLGLFEDYFRGELTAVFTILLIINIWVGLITSIAALGVGAVSSVTSVIFITLVSALLASAFMLPSTTWLAMISFRHGYDPDNIVAPISTLFGDMVTVPAIIGSYELSASIGGLCKELVIASSLGVIAFLTLHTFRRGLHDPAYRRGLRVLRENIPMILSATSLSMLAGLVLLVNINRIVESVGVLAVIPAFLEDGGAIAIRFSSRLSTSLHLGMIKPSPIPSNRWVLTQFVINMAHGLMIFTSLATFGYLIALMRGGMSIAGDVFLSVIAAGLVLTALVTIVTYYGGVASFKAGIDPDNVLAPILTSIADITGTLSLATFISVIIHTG